MVSIILKHFLWNQYIISLQALNLYWLNWWNPFHKTFIKIYYFPKFQCHILQKWRAVQFLTILTIFHCSFLWITSARETVRTILRTLFEDTTVTINLLKNHICNSSCTEINTFLAIISNKKIGNFQVRPNHSILTESLFKYKCYEIGYPDLSEKVTFSRNTCH